MLCRLAKRPLINASLKGYTLKPRPRHVSTDTRHDASTLRNMALVAHIGAL